MRNQWDDKYITVEQLIEILKQAPPKARIGTHTSNHTDREGTAEKVFIINDKLVIIGDFTLNPDRLNIRIKSLKILTNKEN